MNQFNREGDLLQHRRQHLRCENNRSLSWRLLNTLTEPNKSGAPRDQLVDSKPVNRSRSERRLLRFSRASARFRTSALLVLGETLIPVLHESPSRG